MPTLSCFNLRVCKRILGEMAPINAINFKGIKLQLLLCRRLSNLETVGYCVLLFNIVFFRNFANPVSSKSATTTWT